MTVAEIIASEKSFREIIDKRLEALKATGKCKDIVKLDDEVIDDGCMDPNSWVRLEASGRPRILWVLKEHNGCTYEYGKTGVKYGVPAGRMRVFWDMHVNPYGISTGKVGFVANVNKYRSLKLIEIASRSIISGEKSIPVYGPESDVSKYAVETYRQLAFIEIGKTAGAAKTSHNRLSRLCEIWGEIVKEQIFALRPTIIIVAGQQFDYLFKAEVCKDPSNAECGCAACHIWKGVPMIRTYHPGYWFVSRKHWIDSVVEAARKTFKYI